MGEETKPMYTVAISNDLAQENMKKGADARIKRRWDYESSDSDSDDEKPSTKERTSAWQASEYDKETGINSSSITAVGSAGTRRANLSPLGNAAVTTDYGLSHTDSKQSRARSLRSNRSAEGRRQDIETLGGGLQRGTTKGRRKAGATVAPSTVNSTASGEPNSNYPPSNQGFNNPYMQQQQGLAAAQAHSPSLSGPLSGTEGQYPQQPPATFGSQSQRPPLPLSSPFPGPPAQYLPQPPPPPGPLPPQPDGGEKSQ